MIAPLSGDRLAVNPPTFVLGRTITPVIPRGCDK
jgi:hypothetical protein